MDPTRATIHLDQPLTDMSIAYMEDDTIVKPASLVFPPVKVKHRNDKYFTYGKQNLLLVEARIAPNAEPQCIEFALSEDSYDCELYKLRGKLSLDDLADQDEALDLELDTTRIVQEIFNRAYEYVVASMCVGASPSFSNGNSYAAPTDKWDDYTNSDPLGDIETAKTSIKTKSGGKKANLMVLCEDVWDILRYHPDILDALAFQAPMGGVKPMMVTVEAFAELIGVEKVVIADQMMIDDDYDDVDTATPTYVWAGGYFIAHVEEGARLRGASAGKGFYWIGRGTAAGGEESDTMQGAAVGAPNVYKWDELENDFRFIQLKMYVDPKVTSDVCGYYGINVIS